MAVRLIVNNARRPRADSFPTDTPEPVAEPYGSIDAVLTPALRRAHLFFRVLIVCAVTGAAFCLLR